MPLRPAATLRRRLARGVLLLLGSLVGCSAPRSEVPDGRLRVVTTTGIVADVVKHVGGDHVRVQALMGPGVDPHLYKASEGDVRRLFRAQLIFFNGLHLEAKMGEVLEHMGGRTRTVAVTGGISAARLLSAAGYPGASDPHIWFDVALWAETIPVVRDALIRADPAHEAEYRANAEAYREELVRLHEYVLAQANRVPPARRVLITAHDAFGYFGRAYGFEVRGLQGISTASEAGTADVQRLAELITERRIPAVFLESSIPPRAVEAVQAAVRSRGFEVQLGGELFSDALGDPGTPEGTYVGMVRHNIDTIVGALLRARGAGSS